MANRSSLTDDQLVKQFIGGCNEAFDEILCRYKDRLYSYISYFVKNDDMADDLFQETFVKAIVNLKQGRYKEDGRFYPWLTRIAHNLLIDLFRKEKDETFVYDTEAEKAWDGCNLLDSTREDELSNAQVLNDVRRLMDHLPEPQREVVYMRYYQGISFKEIAEITGVSINTALGRMHYGINNMRRMAEENNISLAIY